MMTASRKVQSFSCRETDEAFRSYQKKAITHREIPINKFEEPRKLTSQIGSKMPLKKAPGLYKDFFRAMYR